MLFRSLFNRFWGNFQRRKIRTKQQNLLDNPQNLEKNIEKPRILETKYKNYDIEVT